MMKSVATQSAATRSDRPSRVPPGINRCPFRLEVQFDGRTVADTRRGFRIVDGHDEPTYYIPPEDVDHRVLSQAYRSSYDPGLGRATFYDVVGSNQRWDSAAWVYDDPEESAAKLSGYVAFDPRLVDEYRIDGDIDDRIA